MATFDPERLINATLTRDLVGCPGLDPGTGLKGIRMFGLVRCGRTGPMVLEWSVGNCVGFFVLQLKAG
ncbi:MAG: hypothetical protein ACYCPT_08280 [Acidimicrobiales bacterium]